MNLTPEQVGVLLAPIKPHRVKNLDGHSHVEAHDIRAMLIRVFGFGGWDLVATAPAVCLYERATTLKSGKDGVKVGYRAELAIVIHGEPHDAHYAGSAVAEATMPDYLLGDAHDMALKSAESGALKRAAMNLGDQFGLSLYNDGSLAPLVRKVVGHEPPATPVEDPDPAPTATEPAPVLPQEAPTLPLASSTAPKDTGAADANVGAKALGFTSAAQQQALLRGLRAASSDAGFSGDDRVAWLTAIELGVGHPVETSKALTKAEIKMASAWFNTQRDQRKAAHR